jgi:hypothetical protein
MNVQVRSDEGTYTQNIHNSSTRSHPSEEETRTRNRKCKHAFREVRMKKKHNDKG